MEGYGQGGPQKGLLIDPFVEHFKTANLGKLSLPGRIHLSIIFLWLSAASRLHTSAVRKELLIASFIELFKNVALGKYY